MDTFAYVSGFTSIVLALGVTRLLIGLGRLVEKRSQIRLYWVHLMWVANIFLFLSLEWWILFRWSVVVDWTFYLFMFLMASPTIVFLLCVMLFPEPLIDGTDFKTHFYKSRKWFFALGAALPPLDFVDTLLKGTTHFTAQGPLYVVTISLMTALSIVAAITSNEKYQKFFSIFFFIYILVFISINLSTLA
jgi:hypothetical protein